MRIRGIRYLLAILCGMTTFAACHNEDFAGDNDKQGGASLSISFRSSDTGLVTRGIEDLNDDGSTSEEEVIADGRKMYRLGVFLAEGNTVHAYTVLESDDSRFINDNTEAMVSFDNLDYNKTYQLYAVANYGDYETSERNILTGHLQDISADNVTATHNVTVAATEGSLCKSTTPYPLSLKKEINLNPGNNTVTGELLRTYARIRITVRNQSSHGDLTITELSFPEKFTSTSVDLFTEGGVAETTPIVTSANAITPFQADKTIGKMDANGTVTESTIFDGYLLESSGGSYQYTLGVKYEGGTTETYTVSETAINNVNNIEDGAMYVIYSTNSQRYLYTDGNTVSTGASYLNNEELDNSYVWKLNALGNNRYTIESMGSSGYFIQSSAVSGTGIPLTASVGTEDYFTVTTVQNNSNNYLRFQSTAEYSGWRDNYPYYLSVNNNIVAGAYGNNNQNRRNFYLYKVENTTTNKDVTHSATIPINIIDNESGEASALTEIRRNDFINILVNVTYNEKEGDIMFEVADWDEVNGNITFD